MNKMHIITPDTYPESLREIPDAPKLLHIRGTLPDPEKFLYLAIVGSRRYTNYGHEACEKIIDELRGAPVAIVSGLALGIDAIALSSALRAGLPAIAVPGSGLNPEVLYPATNRPLAEKILSSGGALVSEFPPDFRATPYSFPQRNRIMAGMSRGVLVVEAGEKSGTLITSRLATDYNRDVFVIPGPIFSPNSRGSNGLLKLGAIPITSGADILEQWGLNEVTSITYQTSSILNDCSDEEKTIIELLNEPTSKDELIRQSGFSITRANILLSTLEIKGVIKETMGEIHLAV